MLDLIRRLIPDDLIRAKFLKYLRSAAMAAGAAVLTFVTTFLVQHHFSIEDATAIATVVSSAVAGLILTVGSALFSQWDATHVDKIQASSVIDTASTVAAAIGSGQTTPQQIQAAVAQGKPALDAALAALKSGQA